MKLLITISFFFLFLVLPFAQETKNSNDKSNSITVKRQWEFKKPSWRYGIKVKEGDRIKLLCRIPNIAKQNKIKGYLIEVAEDSLSLINKKGVLLNIPKDQIIKLSIMPQVRLLSIIYGIIGVIVASLIVLMIVTLGSLSGRQKNLIILGFAVGVIGLALAIASPKKSITKPFSGDWDYFETSRTKQLEREKAIYLP